ncbi:(2Fe-2S)-binding protein [Clostridia bacterium OttesenSCG-928-O13]|nr:(2Fe-2S)-binding protein [Clostridia bacterium OttesenSCG-928-O13]
MKTKTPITITVNGHVYESLVDNHTTLLEYLRGELALTGAKYGCGEGECGACTVLMDDKPVNACLVLAVRASGSTVLTVEGLSHGDDLHPLQQAFLDKGALQCGYCTPGMLISSYALLAENHNPTDDEIADALAGNLCRCTGYQKIYDAVHEVAEVMFPEGGDELG